MCEGHFLIQTPFINGQVEQLAYKKHKEKKEKNKERIRDTRISSKIVFKKIQMDAFNRTGFDRQS